MEVPNLFEMEGTFGILTQGYRHNHKMATTAGKAMYVEKVKVQGTDAVILKYTREGD